MKLISLIKEKLCYIFMFLVNKFVGVKKNKFYFIGVAGKYNDNSRAVSENLYKRYPEAKIFWSFSNTGSKDIHIPNYVHRVVGIVNQYFHMASSSYWITSGVIIKGLYKSKKQVYIDLWHGDRAIKKILNDKLPEYKRKKETYNTKYCDLMTSGSLFYDKLINTAFCYYGTIIHSGSPRNDFLFKEDEQKKILIKQELGISHDVRILLYAPTFRDHAVYEQTENINIEKIILAFEKATSEKWICLGRFHPLTRSRNKFKSNRVIDVTDYYDITDLLYISDAHITDYSSSAGDFALLNRPVFLFQADRADYEKNDREFYFKMEDSPFWIASSQEDLEHLIKTKMKMDFRENCKAILDFYGTTETGHASDDVVDFMINRIS